ncbi:hypothetical protein SAMN04487890_107229 [Mucilaginibacter polytrichastri]|nr:hypothetical protein SAMN04487890_107229 [Mucilaginibacter polytrichastri]
MTLSYKVIWQNMDALECYTSNWPINELLTIAQIGNPISLP